MSIPLLHQPTLSFTAAARRRIFAPSAYERVRTLQMVPVSLEEGLKFAGLLPVAWQGTGPADGRSSLQLVVIRSLLPGGLGHLDILRDNLTMLPRILYAYPFTLAARASTDVASVPLFYDDVADEPRDVGAPVATTSGLPTRATHLRLRALARLDQDLQVANALTLALQKADLFEPWHLAFQAGDQPVGLKDVWIVKRNAFDTGRIAPILAQFDARTALFLGYHRLSLYRAGALVRQAEVATGTKLVTASAQGRTGGHA